MYFKYKQLYDVLNRYKKIIIYGTGDFAQHIYPQLVSFGLKEKIICFTQTKDSDKDSMDGIPIISIGRLSDCNAECVILIAVSELYVQEIKQTLSDYGYTDYVSLTDYKFNHRSTEKNIVQLETFEDYCGCIADWYVYRHNNNEMSGTVFRRLFHRGTEAKKREENLIVMVCGNLTPRTVKVCRALKKKHFEVVMLWYSGGINPWCFNSLYELGLKIEECKCIEEMLYRMLQYTPLVYFVEPRWSDCRWTSITLKNKKYFGKVVVALHDVMNDGHPEIGEEKLAEEKYTLEHADGIIWRWFSKEYLESKGFAFQGKSLQFLDYCRCVEVNNTPAYSESPVVKICMGAGYGDEYVDDRAYRTKYIDFARIGEILDKIGNRQDCAFHFFVGSLSEKCIIRCQEYQKKYNNFKFYLDVEYDELQEKLKDYDYGCEIWTDGEEPPDDITIGEYSGSNYRDCVRNIYFDFIESGVPIITTSSSKLWDFLSEYDIVVKMNLANMDIDYLKNHRNYYKEKVMEARKELTMDRHIERLIRFFKNI